MMLAVARPMPLAAAVISATLPLNRIASSRRSLLLLPGYLTGRPEGDARSRPTRRASNCMPADGER